jgi:hypothetical protein
MASPRTLASLMLECSFRFYFLVVQHTTQAIFNQRVYRGPISLRELYG